MRRGLAVAIAILGLAAAPSALAAQRGSGEPNAETRYRDCMDEIAVDAQQALRTAKAWQKDDGGDPARHCAAAAEMELGQFIEAAEMLEALARGGGAEIADNRFLHASLWGQAAFAWLSADEPGRAEDAATQAMELAPRDAGLLVLRARARATERRFADAIGDLDRAILIDPNDTDAYVFRGSALRQTRALEQAAADLDKALSLNPQQPEALLERGIVRHLQGNDAGARADWLALTETAPKTPAAESARLNLERLDKER
jgi:tetratricopeptide (TPR) repeat protein